MPAWPRRRRRLRRWASWPSAVRTNETPDGRREMTISDKVAALVITLKVRRGTAGIRHDHEAGEWQVWASVEGEAGLSYARVWQADSHMEAIKVKRLLNP